MAARVVHAKVSTLPDGSDTKLVNASDWNDDHVLEGVVEEAPSSDGPWARQSGGWVKIKASDATLTWGSVSISSGAIDLSTGGDVPRVLLTENVSTIAFPSLPATGVISSLLVLFIQDSSGGHSAAGWPDGIVWASGSAPTIASAPGAMTAVSFLIHSDGLIVGGV